MVTVFELFPFFLSRWFVPFSFLVDVIILIYLLKPPKRVIGNSLLAGFSLAVFNFVWETANVLCVLAQGREIDAGYIGGFNILWTGIDTFPVFTFWGAAFCLVMYRLSKRRYSAAYVVPFFLGITTLSGVGDYNMVQMGGAYVPGIQLFDPGIWIIWLGFFIILDMFFWILNTRSKRKGYEI